MPTPILKPKSKYVYVVGCLDSGMVKIGVTDSPLRRAKAIKENFEISSLAMAAFGPTEHFLSAESESHSVLSRYLSCWVGRYSNYPRECFLYPFKKAVWIIRNISNQCKQSQFYRELMFGESFWEWAECKNSYPRDHDRCSNLIDAIEAHEYIGEGRFQRLRRYRDPRTGEIRKTVEVWI